MGAPWPIDLNTWHSPVTPVVLNAGQVHVWRVSLAEWPEPEVGWDVLSEAEQARANRFKFERDQRRFIVSRSRLRAILGRYINQSPTDVKFDYGEFGKPFVPAEPTLQFNLSHSGEIALCAVTLGRKLGIDIEQLRSIKDLASLSRRCLTHQEQSMLQQQLTSEQPLAFLQYWTCKEAYLKAIGKGLTQSLQSVGVELLPKPQLIQVPEPGNWQLGLIDPGLQDYVAALVSEGKVEALCFEDCP